MKDSFDDKAGNRSQPEGAGRDKFEHMDHTWERVAGEQRRSEQAIAAGKASWVPKEGETFENAF